MHWNSYPSRFFVWASILRNFYSTMILLFASYAAFPAILLTALVHIYLKYWKVDLHPQI